MVTGVEEGEMRVRDEMELMVVDGFELKKGFYWEVR